MFIIYILLHILRVLRLKPTDKRGMSQKFIQRDYGHKGHLTITLHILTNLTPSQKTRSHEVSVTSHTGERNIILCVLKTNIENYYNSIYSPESTRIELDC